MKSAFFAIFQQELQNSTMMVFCVSKFKKKMGEFAVSIEHSEAKSVSASGGLRPRTSRPGALPLEKRKNDASFIWILCSIHPQFTFREIWIIEENASSVLGQ